MARMLNWNTTEFEIAIHKAGMKRLKTASLAIAADMKRTLKSQTHGPYPPRIPGRYKMVIDGKLVPSTDPPKWMERWYGAMVDTIRVVTKPQHEENPKDLWIMAGNWQVWWAVQLEFGHGGWKGGRKSFFRPALSRAAETCRGIMENG